MTEVLEYYYTYNDILTLIKYIYSIVQTESCWLKKKIKTMNLKVGLKQCKTDNCILYRVNELGAVIVNAYVDGTLEIGDKSELMHTIEYIKKEYVILSMGELEGFVVCSIKRGHTKMTLKIYHPYLITKITKLFNKYVKSLINFNTQVTSHKGMVCN